MTQEEKIDALMEMVKDLKSQLDKQDGQNNNFINRRGTSPFR